MMARAWAILGVISILTVSAWATPLQNQTSVTTKTPVNTTNATPNGTVNSPVTTPTGVSPANTAVPALTGSVTTTTPDPKTMLSATQLESPITHDLLKKKCHVLTIKLTNNTPDYLEVLQAEVLNGLDANSIAAEEAQASQRRRSIGSGLLRIAASAIPYAGYGSMAAYQAVNIGSNVAYQSANMIGQADAAGPGVVTGLQQRINNLLVNPNNSVQFQTLVAKNTPAQVRVTFKNVKTNEIFSYQIAE